MDPKVYPHDFSTLRREGKEIPEEKAHSWEALQEHAKEGMTFVALFCDRHLPKIGEEGYFILAIESAEGYQQTTKIPRYRFMGFWQVPSTQVVTPEEYALLITQTVKELRLHHEADHGNHH